MSEQPQEPQEPQHEVIEASGGVPTGAPNPDETTEQERSYADAPSRGGRANSEVAGSEMGGTTSGGGAESGTTPQVGNLRREGQPE